MGNSKIYKDLSKFLVENLHIYNEVNKIYYMRKIAIVFLFSLCSYILWASGEKEAPTDQNGRYTTPPNTLGTDINSQREPDVADQQANIILNYSERHIESENISNDTSEDDRINIVRELLLGSEKTVNAYLGAMRLAQIENEFNFLTNVFRIEEIRDSWDWITSIADIISIGGIGIGTYMTIENGNNGPTSDALITVSTSVMIGIASQIITGFRSPKVESEALSIAIDLAVARQGYEDLCIRKKQYEIIIAHLEDAQSRLIDVSNRYSDVNDERNKQFSTNDITKIQSELLKSDTYWGELVVISDSLYLIATEMLSLLEEMYKQATTYKIITERLIDYNAEIVTVVNEYTDFISMIETAIEYHQKVVVPDFQQMKVTLTALSLRQ